MAELLPDKFTPVEHTILGEAASLVTRLNEGSASIGQIYVDHKVRHKSATFDSFAAALTFLYTAGVVEYTNNIVRRI